MSSIRLEQVRIGTPCDAAWDQMAGTPATRFCAGCQKSVHDLSAMTRSEAERHVCQSADDLCVRLVRQSDGMIATLDYQTHVGPRPWSWRVWSVIGLAGALVAGLVNAVLFGDRVMPKPTPAPAFTVVMGDMVFVPSSGSQTPPCPTSVAPEGR
jgi:hypothetical protein